MLFISKTQIFACRDHLCTWFDPCNFFFDFEVIFHMLFQFGTEESAGCGQIHRNNSDLVLNRHPIEPHKYLIWPHGAVIEPDIRSYEVSMRFYVIFIKYQSWVVSVNLSTYIYTFLSYFNMFLKIKYTSSTAFGCIPLRVCNWYDIIPKEF